MLGDFLGVHPSRVGIEDQSPSCPTACSFCVGFLSVLERQGRAAWGRGEAAGGVGTDGVVGDAASGADAG